MNNEPNEIQQNRHHYRDNRYFHVQTVEVVLGKNQENQRVDKKVEKVILVENYENLHAEQYYCQDQDNLQRPALLTLRGRSCKNLTCTCPHRIAGPSWVTHRHSA